MKKFFLAFIFLCASISSHAIPVQDGPVSFDLARVKVSELVHLFYRDVLLVPYVIAPELVNDDRLISFRLSSQKNPRPDFLRLLDSIGIDVDSSTGVDYLRPKKSAAAPVDTEVFVYRPKHRDASYLSELVRPLFEGKFTVSRALQVATPSASPVPAGSAASLLDRGADVLIFTGTAAEVRSIQNLFAQIDDRPGEVMVRGVLYEVASGDRDASAFSLALNLLGGKFTITGGAINALDNAIRFSTGTIDAVVTALSADSRFKVVSSPSLRVRSGASGRFSVGQDVPVLGSVSYPGNGNQSVQSVEYRSSGVIFDLQPVVRASTVDLTVNQQLSSFVATETGVNSTPTLLKREVKTNLTLSDGDIVVLGGLAENKETQSRSGLSFMPQFMHSKSLESSRSEILLILQLTKI